MDDNFTTGTDCRFDEIMAALHGLLKDRREMTTMLKEMNRNVQRVCSVATTLNPLRLSNPFQLGSRLHRIGQDSSCQVIRWLDAQCCHHRSELRLQRLASKSFGAGGRRWRVHQSMQLRKCDGRPGQGGRLLALAGKFRGFEKEIGDGFQADDAPLSCCFSCFGHGCNDPWMIEEVTRPVAGAPAGHLRLVRLDVGINRLHSAERVLHEALLLFGQARPYLPRRRRHAEPTPVSRRMLYSIYRGLATMEPQYIGRGCLVRVSGRVDGERGSKVCNHSRLWPGSPLGIITNPAAGPDSGAPPGLSQGVR